MKGGLSYDVIDLDDDVYAVLKHIYNSDIPGDKANNGLEYPVRDKVQVLKDSVVDAVHIYLNIPRYVSFPKGIKD